MVETVSGFAPAFNHSIKIQCCDERAASRVVYPLNEQLRTLVLQRA